MEKIFKVDTPYTTSNMGFKKISERFHLTNKTKSSLANINIGEQLTVGSTTITRIE